MRRLVAAVGTAGLLLMPKIVDEPNIQAGYYVAVESQDEKIQSRLAAEWSKPQLEPTRNALRHIQSRYNRDQSEQHKSELLNELRMLDYYKTPFQVNRRNTSDLSKQMHPDYIFAAEVLYDSEAWNRVFWRDWDEIPGDVLAIGLKRQFAQYKHYLTSKSWETMHTKDWDAIPGPVKTAAFMLMIKQASKEWKLEELLSEPEKVYGSIIITESLFEHRAYGGDVGLAQLSPYARKVLSRREPFKGFDAEFQNPLTSIRGGAAWLRICLEEAKGDVDRGIMAYNVGITDALRSTPKARVYQSMVEDKLDRYFRNALERGRTWNFIQTFLEQISSDELDYQRK